MKVRLMTKVSAATLISAIACSIFTGCTEKDLYNPERGKTELKPESEYFDFATTAQVAFDVNYGKIAGGALIEVFTEDTEDGGMTFTFKVPQAQAGQTIPVSLRRSKKQTWYDTMYLWMYIPTPEETSTPEPSPEPTPSPNPMPNPEPTPTPTPEATVANGIYSMDVVSSSSMFKVVDCILTAKDGKMSAVLTLSGTGYGYLYMGTKEEAAILNICLLLLPSKVYPCFRAY